MCTICVTCALLLVRTSPRCQMLIAGRKLVVVRLSYLAL